MATSFTSLQRAVATVLLPLLACLGPPCSVQFALGLDGMLTTNFSCVGKIIGGYYADQYTNCQMFHVCTLDEKGKVNDYTFRCLAGTVFDQETRVCERAEEVDCSRSKFFFHLNNDLYGPGIIPSTAHITVIDEVEATARTDTSARTPDHKSSMATTTTTTTTTTTPPPPSPQFVFPETSFTCTDKIHGGLYADVETGCKVFHICSVEPDRSVKSNKFTCGPGTLFDQKSRTCQVESGVDCAVSPTFYYLNERGNLPVFVERAQPILDQAFPEQQFDFPRIPSSPSSPSLSTSRVRRSAGNSVVVSPCPVSLDWTLMMTGHPDSLAPLSSKTKCVQFKVYPSEAFDPQL